MADRVLNLKKMIAYSERKKTTGKRFDYDGIRNELVKLCNKGKSGLDRTQIKNVIISDRRILCPNAAMKITKKYAMYSSTSAPLAR